MGKVHGVKRVCAFCMLTAVIPAILIITPLYLRHNVFADVTYEVAESDVLAIKDGVSSIFCESHSLQMNTSFNAFQLSGTPKASKKLRHIRLKKSMTLPDDTLEYWGFYLSSGAVVKLRVCSRYNGSRILVVRGDKNLKTCGLLQPSAVKYGARFDQDHNRVKVTFENPAEVIGVVDDQVIDKNTAAEDMSDDKLELFEKMKQARARSHASKKSINLEPLSLTLANITDSENSTSASGKDQVSKHHKRHIRRKVLEKHSKINDLKRILDDDEEPHIQAARPKRDVSPLDAHIAHGGNNARNNTYVSEESDISSFENDLLTCYDGQILLSQGFPSSRLCKDVHYLEENHNHMQTLHEVASDGYYYYIFYSDNDFISNDIHAIFDIYKPTYHFANVSKGNDCINQTECKFPIGFLRDETVIVEVPTRDGIEHEADDITLLVSKCHPRVTVYMVFPITALFLILGCAFL